MAMFSCYETTLAEFKSISYCYIIPCLYILSDQREDHSIRGRMDGGGEELDPFFYLIEENEDEVPVRSKFPESRLFRTKEIG